jgi:hypothetical protein
MAKGVRGSKHHNWKGDAATKSTKRQRATRLFQLGPCEQCGRPATDRHHKDDDPGNNNPSNIMILCRRCHMVLDGRLERLIAMAPLAGRRKGPQSCQHCGQPYKPLRKGLCAACSQYQRVHGEPRPLDGNFRPRKRPTTGNAAKTHCSHGHPFDEENTYIYKNRKRHCRACDAARKRAAKK